MALWGKALPFWGALLAQAPLQGPHPILGSLQGAPRPLGLSQPLALAEHHLAKSPAWEQKQRAPGGARELGEGAAPCTAPLSAGPWKGSILFVPSSLLVLPRVLQGCSGGSLSLAAKGKSGVPASPPGKATSSSFLAG